MATPATATLPSVSNGQSAPKPLAPPTAAGLVPTSAITKAAEQTSTLPGGKREASIDMLFGGEKKVTPVRPAAKAPPPKTPTQATNNTKPATPAGSAPKPPSSTLSAKPAAGAAAGQAKPAANSTPPVQKPQQSAPKPPVSASAPPKPSTTASPAKATPSTTTPSSATPKSVAIVPPKATPSPLVKTERPDTPKQLASAPSVVSKSSPSVTPVKATIATKAEPTTHPSASASRISSPSKSSAPLPVKEEKHKEKEHKKKRHKSESEEEEEEEEEEKPKPKSKSKDSKPKAKPDSSASASTGSTQKKKKRAKEEDGTEHVWRWWEEQKHHDDSRKWTFLEHNGPLFPPAYEPLPADVRFLYDGRPMKLSLATEELASYYGQMLKHDYTSKDVFNKNFYEDWRKVMNHEERQKITDLTKCDFREINAYFERRSEERKNRGKEEKAREKEERDEIQKKYGIANLDGHKEKIANYRIEPPGLFRGRGTHPKMGKFKRRVQPEDVIINCSKDAKVPQPPPGHKWKEVRHDSTVTWLVTWTENVMGQNKYVMLNSSSKLKGEKDWKKYETARKLHTIIDQIRDQYKKDWKAHETEIRQRAVALYFIDKLALRAGNEKDEDEADTVGCCSLRVEHIRLHDSLMIDNDEKHYVVEFDFLGKDSIRYFNRVPVEKRVYKNLKIFLREKQPSDELFDRLTTTKMNKHLHDIMDGLTAKVFRTYNASRTLEEQLEKQMNELKDDANVAEKMLAYNRANRSVAILCNHQRSVPKNFTKQMEDMEKKISEKHKEVKQAKKEAKQAKADYKATHTDKNKKLYEQKKKAYLRLVEQQRKLEVTATDRDENKTIALSTSKLNYSDPRISVAWCKKHEVPIEKVYNKTQREKFRWAIDMADEDYRFIELDED